MRRLFATATLAIASSVWAPATAVAQPALRGDGPSELRDEMCGVTFVRAPDDVRYVIEQWLRAEPRCTSSIELRVVPTEGGLYLLAQRPDGRIHERLVPDPQSAGVLVASWVADAWTAAPPPVSTRRAPAAVVSADAPAVSAVLAPSYEAAPPGKWVSFGLSVDPNGYGGFRGEAELVKLGGWKLGAVASYAVATVESSSDGTLAWGSMRDTVVLATLSRAVRYGGWELRGALGAGVIHTRAESFGSWTPMDVVASRAFPTAEASVLLTRRIGYSWGLAIGPAVAWIDESFSSDDGTVKLERTLPQLMVFGGLRYEL